VIEKPAPEQESYMVVTMDRDLIVQLASDLICFPSVNPPGNERAPAEYLAKRMEDLGLEVELQMLEEHRANVIGRIPGAGCGHLVLSGHLDVVPPGEQRWERDPFGGEVSDGRIYGRGSCDMKGSVAAMVGAVAALQSEGFHPKGDVIIAASAGEEAGMMGAKAMVERRSLEGAAFLVVGEPTGLDVFIGEKGLCWLKIRALGRTAHGAMPWQGVNAVSYMARLITRLEPYPFSFTESELLGKPSLSPNIIRGGNSANVVPDVCELNLDMRTVPSQSHEALIQEVRDLAESVAADFDPEIRVEIDIDLEKPGLETDAQDPLVDAVVASVTAVRGVRPTVSGVMYGTDAAYLGPGFRVPMVICGPGGIDMLHQPNEFVEIEQLMQGAEIYADLARRLLG
jgi:succinyl-diaminopimelate desuccinylase